MNPCLHVLAPGLVTTVQDFGRVGFQRLGVSVCGAIDPVSLRAANLLVGNPADAGALEILCLGPTLAVEADAVRVAVMGGPAAIDILPDAAAAGGRRIEPMSSARLVRGETLRIGALSGASVLYLAVEGGFAIEPVLGSVATDIRGGIGGWQGRALRAGDRLPLRQGSAAERGEVQIEGIDVRPRPRIRVIVGPQADHFADSEVAAFLASAYVIGPSDRMGIRLQGRPLAHARGFDIVSDGIAAGAIQVPGDGQPIVLSADRQTTGGYPKIATVISADLPALVRHPVGARVTFEAVSQEAAAAARQQYVTELAAIKDKIVPLRRHRADVAARLQQDNLISGFVSAL